MESLYPSSEKHSSHEEVKSYLKVRCPDCLKLYAIDPQDINSSQPKFQCLHCQSLFGITFTEAVSQKETVGTKIQALSTEPPSQVKESQQKVEEQFEPCPKCQKLYMRGLHECPHCGVWIAKFFSLKKLRDEEELGFPASKKLRKAWSDVMDSYDQMAVHQRFLHSCQQERNLVFASRQYGKILEIQGGDEIALKMRDQILAMTQLPFTGREEKEPQQKNVPIWKLSNIIIFFSTLLIATGLMVETGRNMVGVGVAIIFFTLAFSRKS